MLIITWCTGIYYDDVSSTPDLGKFSSSYTAIFLFVVLVLICSKKDLAIFMRIGSFGVIFIIFLMAFIMATGFIAIGDTSFVTGSMD